MVGNQLGAAGYNSDELAHQSIRGALVQLAPAPSQKGVVSGVTQQRVGESIEDLMGMPLFSQYVVLFEYREQWPKARDGYPANGFKQLQRDFITDYCGDLRYAFCRT
jgi:hypothetical protein